MKIVADNTVPFLKGIAEPFAEVVYLDSKAFTPEAVRDADALIVRSIDKCTRELLEGSRVRLITTATIGFDHIDTHYCEEAGITWRNAPGCNAASVAQYVLVSLIAIALRRGESLAGKTIGIVGVGHVGSIVARYAEAWGMRVLLNDPPRAAVEGDGAFVPLETIKKEADIVTLHVPLTREGQYATYHLADADFFGRLRRKPWFVNSCRGAVMDTAALIQAKRAGQVGELVIDCWENEPAISPELLELTTIATPHIAGFSADGKANGTRACLRAISEFFNVEVERLKEVTPPEPADPVIDLSAFADHRLERAVLRTFESPSTMAKGDGDLQDSNIWRIDRALRESPERFEWFRAHYDHPREPRAYHLVGQTSREWKQLGVLKFHVD